MQGEEQVSTVRGNSFVPFPHKTQLKSNPPFQKISMETASPGSIREQTVRNKDLGAL